MVREILKIRTDNGLGNSNPTFKDIELTEYSAKFPRMGMPSLSATLMWATPLDREWTRKEYVVLRGDIFFIRHTPSSSKSNTDSRYKHEIEFTSEFAEILGNTYFVDAVLPYAATYDKPCTNNTKFTFYGTIGEFVDRLNCALAYAGIGDSILNERTYYDEEIKCLTTLDEVVGDGYCAMLDPYGDYDPEKTYEFSFEDKSFWEAITYGYETTEIPFERHGRVFIFGAVPNVVQHKFEYGHDNELLSISKKNANAKVINRITMLGSSENIPYYYPNETEYGHIDIQVKDDNTVLTTDMVEITNMTKLLSRLNADSFAVLRKYGGIDVGNAEVEQISYTYAFGNNTFAQYPIGKYLKHNPDGTHNTWATWHMRAFFRVKEAGMVECHDIRGNTWVDGTTAPDLPENIMGEVTLEALKTVEDKSQGIESVDYSSQMEKGDGVISLGYLPKGTYFFQFSVKIQNLGGARGEPVTSICRLTSVEIKPATKQKTGYYWEVGDKKYDNADALGVKITRNLFVNMVGDGFGWTASGRMPFQDHLMPPKYRKSLGDARFYNAVNDKYTDPDTHNKYVFPNPFVAGAPSEHIFRDDNRKPTIEGIRNAVTDPETGLGQLFGVIADIAYDENDNDVLKPDNDESDKNDALKYEHSFFYIKLNIFNGDYGFNLFAHASQSDPMTMQMRSGSCNGCKFKIQALEYTDNDGFKSYKNPVQTTGANGDIVDGDYADKVKEDWQEWQQNTETNSIWICVQKDADTFGVIMPNQSNNFKPKIGDRFNIINIDLPQSYILFAEQRLEDDGIRYMADNNEEKFTFDIQASRIFLAENPDVLSQLDENSKIKVKYDGKEYEQYVNQLTIDCKDNEALPNIGIDLTDTLAVGQSFVDNVAERAASLVATAVDFGTGAGGGLSAALAERRYLNKQKADRTPYPLNVGGLFTAESGARFGDFVHGQNTGRGAAIDGGGNAEVESIVVRTFMSVTELIYNRLNAQEGDTSFSDSGTIDVVFDMPDGSRIAQIRRRWEGDFTAFQPGDIIYGYVNDLDRADKKEYYKAWAWIKSVDRENNQLTIVEYPDSEVPSGKNHSISEGMMVAKWGNVIEPSQQAYLNPDYSAVIGKRGENDYYNKRQQSFYISCEDGNIVELMGVNKPILERGNYGTILGKLPDGLLDPQTEELINKDQPYLYARGIVVQDLIRIGYEGLKVRTANYRGMWDAVTANSDTEYYRNTDEMYDTVTWNGALWQNVVTGDTSEPSSLNPAWVKIDIGGEVRIWTINPSATVISVRKDEIIPDILSATVTLNSSDGSPVKFDNNVDMANAGARLFYSTDGIEWKRFVIGVQEPLDLENESGVIELEGSVDDSRVLTVGGDDIDTETIGDRIYFELRSVDDDVLLVKTEVPVVKDGEDGISMRLDPPVLELKKGKAGLYEVKIYITDGDTETGPENFSTLTNEQKEGFTNVTHMGRMGYRFIYDGTTVIDRDIPVTANEKYHATLQIRTISNGLDGRDGLMVYPAGFYDINTEYSSDDETMPVVMYGEEGNYNYYRLKANKTYRGIVAPSNRQNPALDYAINDADTVWILFDKFNSIFANIIMAEFAKLGSAVFVGVWMISQEGVDNDGNFSTAYQDFKTGNFTPNLAINFESGEIRALTGTFKGHIEADSGSFKGHVEAESGVFRNVSIENDCTFAGLFVKTPKVINPSNIESFIEINPRPGVYDVRYIRIEKVGSMIEFRDFTSWQQLGYLWLPHNSKYVGNTILIYNRNNNESPLAPVSVEIQGRIESADGSETTAVIGEGQMGVFTCRIRIKDGEEYVYWEYSIGNSATN